MGVMNSAEVKALFEREAILLGNDDLIPAFRVAELFGKESLKHVRSLAANERGGTYFNGYGVGDYTLEALTYRGFQAAASFSNVQQLRGEAKT